MKKLLICFGALLCGALLSGPGLAQGGDAPRLQLEGYARETLPGAAMSAAYLTLKNAGDRALELQGVELPGIEGAAADLHTTVHENGISRMRPLAALTIPPGEQVAMAPGGVHLMLRGVRLRAGEVVPLRLRFAGGLALEFRVPVVRLKASDGDHHHHG